jgi:excisionase family DNA binding protein
MLNTQVLTPNEAAEYLKVNPQVLEKYLRAGDIPARKIGRQWRINKLALDLWLAPEMTVIFSKLLAWNNAFALGDQIGREILLSDEDILRTVKAIRHDRRS